MSFSIQKKQFNTLLTDVDNYRNQSALNNLSEKNPLSFKNVNFSNYTFLINKCIVWINQVDKSNKADWTFACNVRKFTNLLKIKDDHHQIIFTDIYSGLKELSVKLINRTIRDIVIKFLKKLKENQIYFNGDCFDQDKLNEVLTLYYQIRQVRPIDITKKTNIKLKKNQTKKLVKAENAFKLIPNLTPERRKLTQEEKGELLEKILIAFKCQTPPSNSNNSPKLLPWPALGHQPPHFIQLITTLNNLNRGPIPHSPERTSP